jgi:hypothetical protein
VVSNKIEAVGHQTTNARTNRVITIDMKVGCHSWLVYGYGLKFRTVGGNRYHLYLSIDDLEVKAWATVGTKFHSTRMVSRLREKIQKLKSSQARELLSIRFSG